MAASEFLRWYWLKTELCEFCRKHRLSPSGSKIELQTRIEAFLLGLPAPPANKTSRSSGQMPDRFTLNTVIGKGWRCSPALGAFFKNAAGSGFRFNAAMRDFIHHNSGKTLAQAVAHYHATRSVQRPIAPQLEYNRHFRDYFKAHPGSSKADAIAAWWAKRGKPNLES